MRFFIPPAAVQEEFVRAGGPGGQNVNKVSSGVQLRCDTTQLALSDDVRARLQKLAGRKMTDDGILILKSQTFRTQERNRAAAWQQLEELIQRAHEKPKPRKATKPSRASQEKRLSEKKRRSETKSLRRQDDF
jgi:ribosome-associated protein